MLADDLRTVIEAMEKDADVVYIEGFNNVCLAYANDTHGHHENTRHNHKEGTFLDWCKDRLRRLEE